MKEELKNTNPQKLNVDDTSKKSMKGNSINEESLNSLTKKKDTNEVAESPVEKENKK